MKATPSQEPGKTHAILYILWSSRRWIARRRAIHQAAGIPSPRCPELLCYVCDTYKWSHGTFEPPSYNDPTHIEVWLSSWSSYMQVRFQHEVSVRSGIWTHVSFWRPEVPLLRKESSLESGALDRSAILTPCRTAWLPWLCKIRLSWTETKQTNLSAEGSFLIEMRPHGWKNEGKRAGERVFGEWGRGWVKKIFERSPERMLCRFGFSIPLLWNIPRTFQYSSGCMKVAKKEMLTNN